MDQQGVRLIEAGLRARQLLWKIIMLTGGKMTWVSELVKELAIELYLRLHLLDTASSEKAHKFIKITFNSS